MFQRSIKGVTYNCLRTGKDQYHLFETRPIKGNVHSVKYIHKNWKNLDVDRYIQEVPKKISLLKSCHSSIKKTLRMNYVFRENFH